VCWDEQQTCTAPSCLSRAKPASNHELCRYTDDVTPPSYLSRAKPASIERAATYHHLSCLSKHCPRSQLRPPPLRWQPLPLDCNQPIAVPVDPKTCHALALLSPRACWLSLSPSAFSVVTEFMVGTVRSPRCKLLDRIHAGFKFPQAWDAIVSSSAKLCSKPSTAHPTHYHRRNGKHHCSEDANAKAFGKANCPALFGSHDWCSYQRNSTSLRQQA
jgi:hypothetical protein